MLTVSFDATFDTPPVLRKYGLAYLGDDPSGFSHWDFAFTKLGDLRKFAEAFGLEYFEQDDQIAHTMDIVLITPDGIISTYWATQWTTEELENALQAASRSAASQHNVNQRRYAFDGTVALINSKSRELTVRHKQISGYMPAMTMPFHVSQSPEGLASGDHIHTGLGVLGETAHLENVAITKRDKEAR